MIESKTSTTREATKVLLRIALFLLYYIGLIALGLCIFVGAFFLTKYFFLSVLPGLRSGRAILLAIICIAGVWCLAAMFGLYLVKPIFSFKKNTRADRVEVAREDCPELFKMIDELVAEVHCQYPKHVYLTTDVNACVFYDTSFWSIFFPVKKNLEVGLGLFEGTTTEEVKAILAHEFGHFSQKSMKVGSTVYVVNSVLYNLIYEKDWWDNLLDKWQRSSNGTFRFFGVLTGYLTIGINKLNKRLFRFVQKADRKLSRQMEYEADAISCSIVGREVFTSAMCKIEILAEQDKQFIEYVSELFEKGKTINNYFLCKRISDSINASDRCPVMNVSTPLSEPINNVKSPSRVEINDVWSTHPSLKDRLTNAYNTGFVSKTSGHIIPAWEIMPDETRDQVSRQFLSTSEPASEKPLEVISETEFTTWITDYNNKNLIDPDVQPFITSAMLVSSRDRVFSRDKDIQIDDNPFTEANAQLLSDYDTALNDLETMEGVINKEIDAEMLAYNGIIYKREQIPVEEHKQYLEVLENKTLEIQESIFYFLRGHVPSEQRDNLLRAYDIIFYVQEFSHEHIELKSRCIYLSEIISTSAQWDEEAYRRMCEVIVDLEQSVRECIENRKWNLLVSGEDELDSQCAALQAYAAEKHNSLTTLDAENIDGLFQTEQQLWDVHLSFYSHARKVIGHLMEPFVKRQKSNNLV